MKGIGRTAWETPLRAVLAVGVLACLCFSAGEGLRLTPLPVAPADQVGASDSRREVTLSHATALNRTGPLDVPAQGQLQKRGKRQTPECECPPPGGRCETPFRLLRHTSAGRRFTLPARLLGSKPPGRAPPPAS